MPEQPKVSILIPVYNTAKYLPKCMESVQKQTLKDIEIIAVNDASPDNAAEVLAEYAAKDPRIKVITHEKNGGILAARLSGIAAASGEYIVALDADDTLARDTCRAAYAKAKATGADVVHFCFNVQVDRLAKQHVAHNVQKSLRPYNGTLLGNRVFEGAFVDHLYRWNIAGKFISAEVCRKAAASLPPGYYIMAEDFCFYTMMSFFATHYEPLWKKCYNYVLDVGVSAYTMVDAKGFERNCSGFTALNAVKSFLTTHGVFEKYRDSFEAQELLLVNDLMDRWEHKVPTCEQAQAFEYMYGHYDASALCRSIADYFWNQPEKLVYMMGNAEYLKTEAKPVSKIALFCSSYADSDAFSDFATTASKWRSSGYDVAVFAPVSEKVPEGIRTAPKPFGKMKRTDIAVRIAFWKQLSADGFDTVVYADAEEPRMIFDLFPVKSFKMNFIPVATQEICDLAGKSLGSFLTKTAAIRFADAAAVPEKTNPALFRMLCGRCEALPLASGCNQVQSNKKQYLLWLGDYGRPKENFSLLCAWRKLAPEFPELTLILPGKPGAKSVQNEQHTLINTLNIGGRLQIVKEPNQWEPLLADCACAVLTTLSEAKRTLLNRLPAGVPFVCLAGKTSDQMVEQIRTLLQTGNGEKLNEMPDVTSSWKKFFQSLEQPVTMQENSQAFSSLLSSLRDYAAENEMYLLPPPPQGCSFIVMYRKLDLLISKLLPPGTPRREFCFKACRFVLRFIKIKG